MWWEVGTLNAHVEFAFRGWEDGEIHEECVSLSWNLSLSVSTVADMQPASEAGLALNEPDKCG